MSSVFINIVVTTVKCPWSNFFYIRHFNIDYFTLRYITLHSYGPSKRATKSRAKLLHATKSIDSVDAVAVLDRVKATVVSATSLLHDVNGPLVATLRHARGRNTQGEVTSRSLWSRYDRHVVGITRHNALS